MKARYLEVTFRRGKPLAAYLYLPRAAGVKSGRTEKISDGLLVDYSPEGIPIGIEIVDPAHVSLDRINDALSALGVAPLESRELSPLRAA